MTLTHSVLSGNSATFNGGGIFNNLGGVNLNDTTVSGSSASNGAGIYNVGSLALNNSALSSNSAGQNGGGLFNNSGAVAVVNMSTLASNSAASGGGIYGALGTMNLINSTLSSNSATFSGGIYNDGYLNITNSTFAGNSATGGGGALGHYGGSFLNITNTVLANSSSGGNCYQAFFNMALSHGHNLSDDSSCVSIFTQPGDQNAIPAGLYPGGLQNNGGLTQTVALLSSSPAIDAGDDAVCAATQVNSLDQRGFVRPAGAHCDIGAYEFNAIPPFVDTVGPVTSGVLITPNPLAVNTSSLLTATVSDASTGGSNVASASYRINGSSASQMLLTPSGDVTTQASANLAPFAVSNVYNVCVHGTDLPGNTGADTCVLLPVYDPAGSFVTGSGQVNSPVGADLLNSAADGPATFGFVSKYLPGRNIPSGDLEFQFRQGNLDFRSTNMDWLVVTGEPRAKFHGTGTVNGITVCSFEVDAWAGSFAGNVDAFGLKISSCSSGGDRYSLPATPLIKGSIIIHK